MPRQAGTDLEGEIAALLAAWDNPGNDEAQQTYEDLAGRILRLVTERLQHPCGVMGKP
jgi:microcystin degradation protein MlrC